MHLYILGGSGRTGKLVIDHALKRGHTITAITRDPSKIQPKAGLTIHKGDPYISKDITSTFHSPSRPDAVLVTLSGTSSDNPFAKPTAPSDLLLKSNSNVISEMRKSGVEKIVVMQAQGVGKSLQNMNFLVRWMVNNSASLGGQIKDHTRTFEMLKREGEAGGIEWTALRPAMLKGEERLPVKDMGDLGEGVSVLASCSRGSVAEFMVEAVESGRWKGRAPVIVN